MTRIVAGAARGRRLAVPSSARPTTDRVREAVFSSLETRMDIEGSRVLDLYAGSGALGLEAMSRGAAEATCVESDPRAADVCRANSAATGLPLRVVRASVARFLSQAPPAKPYDVVFADPPYNAPGDQIDSVLEALHARWVAADGVIVLERSARDAPPKLPTGWIAEERRYGETAVHWIARG